MKHNIHKLPSGSVTSDQLKQIMNDAKKKGPGAFLHGIAPGELNSDFLAAASYAWLPKQTFPKAKFMSPPLYEMEQMAFILKPPADHELPAINLDDSADFHKKIKEATEAAMKLTGAKSTADWFSVLLEKYDVLKHSSFANVAGTIFDMGAKIDYGLPVFDVGAKLDGYFTIDQCFTVSPFDMELTFSNVQYHPNGTDPDELVKEMVHCKHVMDNFGRLPEGLRTEPIANWFADRQMELDDKLDKIDKKYRDRTMDHVRQFESEN